MPFHAIIEVWGHFHHEHELGFLYSTYYTKLEVLCHFYHSIKRQSLDINQLLSLMTISIIKIFYQLMEKSSKLLTKVPEKEAFLKYAIASLIFLALYVRLGVTKSILSFVSYGCVLAMLYSDWSYFVFSVCYICTFIKCAFGTYISNGHLAECFLLT